jgi:cellulose synthase/poly-beta-1,6-N-acetylglucosamine synthase-like glycosyltransferase
MSESFPFFSIIVPTYGRTDRLADCLESMVRIDYPRDRFEVIIVDDGSAYSPRALRDRFQDRLELTVLDEPHRGAGAARNAGARIARGSLLAFTSDDCAPAPDWLRQLGRHLTSNPCDAVGGVTRVAAPVSPCADTWQLLMDYLFSYYNAEPLRCRFFTPNNLVVAADRFAAVGGFDPRFVLHAGEDRDFCDRLIERGWRLTLCPDAAVFHAHPHTLASFLRQQFRYGRGSFVYRRRRRDRLGRSAFFAPLSFYAGLVRYPVAVRGWAGWPHAVRLALAQVMTASGALVEWLRGWRARDLADRRVVAE